MSGSTPHQTRLNDIAGQIAIMEMLRALIGESIYTDDRDEFYARLKKFEAVVVDGITKRRHFEKVDDATDAYIREAASAFATKILTSIGHKDDPSPQGS